MKDGFKLDSKHHLQGKVEQVKIPMSIKIYLINHLVTKNKLTK